MVIVMPGKWSVSSGRWFVVERLYRDGKPTLLCKVWFRYLKTMREMHTTRK